MKYRKTMMRKYGKLIFVCLLTLLPACGEVAAQNVKLADLVADLASTDAQNLQRAQQAWQDLCMQAGAPGNAALLDDVNQQTVEQLEKDIPVAVKVWLLREIAWTGDASVVPLLAVLLNDPDLRLRDGAAMALAAITAPEAADALMTALATETDAVNKKRIEDAIAFKTTNLTVGAETQMPFALGFVSDDEVQNYLAGFDQLGNEEQCRTLAALTVRNDKKYRSYALGAIKSDNDALKRAGLLTLEKLGTSDDVPVLIDLLAFDANLVARVASRIVDDKFNDALLNALLAEKDTGRFESLGRILAERHVAAACGILLAEAKKDDCPNRLGYLQIAAGVATTDNVQEMIQVLLRIADRRDRDRAETIIAGVCKGNATPVIGSGGNVSPALYSLLGRIGGNDARDIITQALKSDNAAVRTAALTGLCNWPNATAANEMLVFAKDAKMPSDLRTRALRAYIRVISLPDNQIGIRNFPDTSKLDGLKEAMTLAGGLAEKQLVIDRASAIRIPESVTFAMQYIDDAALAQNVCRTVTELGRNVDLRRRNADVLRPALQKVLEIATNNNLKENAQRYLNDL
ncbi:MAG: HEAT repeat domain-containing protein [Planctomycetaceae bacterium]|nr:HEAT repeat domain-containing protein [Planctomycetaceae bacterium]